MYFSPSHEVVPLINKEEKSRTSSFWSNKKNAPIAAAVGSLVLLGSASFLSSNSGSFALQNWGTGMKNIAAPKLGSHTLIPGEPEALKMHGDHVDIPGVCSSPQEVKLLEFQPKGRQVWEPTLVHERIIPYQKNTTNAKASYVAAFIENNYWATKMVGLEVTKSGDTCTIKAVAARNHDNDPQYKPSGGTSTEHMEFRAMNLDKKSDEDILKEWDNPKRYYEVATQPGGRVNGKLTGNYTEEDPRSFGIEAIYIKALPKTPPPKDVTVTLHTACSPLGSLPFKFNSWNSIGASVVSKSMDADFLFSSSMRMRETTCGTYQVTLPLSYGEEFGFYLHPVGDNSDPATIADIGCDNAGSDKCPARESPAPLAGNLGCTKPFVFGEDTFYNRVFDEQQVVFNWGTCGDSCAVSKPEGCTSPPVVNVEAVMGTRMDGYRGQQSKTVSGKTCQKWTSQSPHSHTRTSQKYPNKGLGDHNHCRNPDNEPGGIWCYTTNKNSRWEYCDPIGLVSVPAAKNLAPNQCDETVRGKLEKGYRGCLAKTASGKTCQKWTSQSPHKHSRTSQKYPNKGLGDHNYCRNPDNEPGGSWCYTTNKNSRWEYCDPYAQ